MVVLALRMVYSVQGQIGEALDEFHQAMRSAAEQQEIALICQYEIGEWLLIATFVSGFFFANNVAALLMIGSTPCALSY